MVSITCAVIGDSGVGKTTLIYIYTTNAILTGFIPRVFDPGTAHLMVDGRVVQLTILDTIGDVRIDEPQRPTAIDIIESNEPDVCLLMFDIMKYDTFHHVKSFWVKELQKTMKKMKKEIPYLLVGNIKNFDNTNRDKIRDYSMTRTEKETEYLLFGFIHKYYSQQALIPKCLIDICCAYYFEIIPISVVEGEVMAKEIGATRYYETHCYGQKMRVFDEAVRDVLFKRDYPNGRRRGRRPGHDGCVLL